jgi:E3 ubiquitin-protein ligase HERC1
MMMYVCHDAFRLIAGCYQWKFLIVKENKGNEGTCVGVARFPIKDYSHRTTTDLWLYRAYRYDYNM